MRGPFKKKQQQHSYEQHSMIRLSRNKYSTRLRGTFDPSGMSYSSRLRYNAHIE